MLVKFHSNVAGELFMFAPVARALLDILGKRADARGVITAEQLLSAIERLQQAVAVGGERPLPAGDGATRTPDDAPATSVSLAQRAFPLIDLMQRTQREDGFILWQAPQDF